MKLLFNLPLYILLLCYPMILLCQDTSFIAKHRFSAPVRNVFEKDDDIYVKTGSGLYKHEGNNWVEQPLKFSKTFVFYEKGFFEADYLPNKYMYDAAPMAYLIPQKSTVNATIALSDNHLFVAAGGSLFEYVINKNYKHLYSDYSIRDIYMEDSLRFMSTYSGIIVNDSLIKGDPKYASGYFRKIGNQYFLSSDQLYAFKQPSSFQIIHSGANLFSGNSRKLLEFNSKIYSLNTKSFNLFDSTIELKPIHQGYEYYDAEVVDKHLIFCTSTGELFAYDGTAVQEILHLSTRIRDIYHFKNMLYLATDKGVYTIQGLETSTLQLLSPLPFSVMVVIDPLRNTWIATENGLYVLPEKKKVPICYIKEVEFNRGALICYNDHIYAGSLSGLYVIDIYHVIKNFLPQYLNKKQITDTEKKNKWILISAIGLLVLAGLYYFYLRRSHQNRKELVEIPHREIIPVLSLETVESAIRDHQLMTVEAMAAFYQTNTVQLNRLFKNFDTTPGKFMKTVKLKMAHELLQQKMPMDAVAQKVGYSAAFLKKELQS